MALILGAAIVVGAFILHKDISTGSDERTTVPILTEVAESDKDVVKVNEPQFYLELPSDWVKSKRVQTNSANFYEWKSTKKGADDRRLLLHIDTMPASYKINKLLPLTPNGYSVIQGNLSSECSNFSTAKSSGTNTVEARWEDVTFVCDPIVNNQTIGTGTAGTGIGTKIGSHTYFFYYEDHNIRPDSAILTDAVKSFKAKS